MVKQVKIPRRYTKYMDRLEDHDAVGVWAFGEAQAINKILRKYSIFDIKCCPIGANIFSLHRNGRVRKTFNGEKYSLYEVE